jgi:integrase
VTGQVVPVNPAASVRGPRQVVTSGQTPVLDPAEARGLLDSIDTAKVAGLRDRALIGLMVYSFAGIGAALGMAVEDVFTQNRRLWVRLREKGGKRHAMPCHHNLEEYLIAYLDGAGLRDDPKGPLFRTIGRGTAYLKNGGTLEKARKMAAHESPRTTRLMIGRKNGSPRMRWGGAGFRDYVRLPKSAIRSQPDKTVSGPITLGADATALLCRHPNSSCLRR